MAQPPEKCADYHHPFRRAGLDMNQRGARSRLDRFRLAMRVAFVAGASGEIAGEFGELYVALDGSELGRVDRS
jgi:hypothetical protein